MKLSQYAPGSTVVVRDEEWLVTGIGMTQDGPLLRVEGTSELVRGQSAQFYASLEDITVLDPRKAKVVGDGSPGYRRARLWLEATLRKTPIPLKQESLSVSSRMLLDVLPYQQEAVRKALSERNLRPRLLLADAVGLGKTLEIGMILSELVRRGRGERILIVTPKHVLEQMQHEMWCRFALPFVRLDSTGLQRVRQKLPATRSPFSMYKRAIISIDTLKSDRYLAYLRRARWDAVVIDESHNVTNSSTQNNRLARTLAPMTDALILASATPHNGKPESFAELVRLLEPTAVRPDGSLDEEAVERLVVRRHRNSAGVKEVVGADWAPRQAPNNVLVSASAAEDAVAHELNDVWLHPAKGKSPYSGATSALFPWTLAKAFLSSPAALMETVAARVKRLDSSPSAATEKAALERLSVLASRVTPKSSAKYQRLLQHLREIGVGKGQPMRAVVFAERVATLMWLQENLRRDLKLPADAVPVLHGGLSDVDQQAVVESFKQSSSPIRVLVTGDVASEGVNLHRQCHQLIHFDVPWSLIRIEQRNGRIDRYGQRHEPLITTLILDPSCDEFAGDVRVLTKLVEKEREAHDALGDAASLMGEHSAEAEEHQIRKVLAGQRGFDDVVKSTTDTAAFDPVTAMLLGLQVDEPPADDAKDAGAVERDVQPLYEREVDFLSDALFEVFGTPEESPARGGVSWVSHQGGGVVELTPPPDLRARLEVLPQGYVQDRRVLSSLKLVTNVDQGKQVLGQALSDASESTWPEAHYLGPLHPVSEWAADQALGRLGRGEVFAVRGSVDAPTVLAAASLTNERGLTVALSFVSVECAPGFLAPTIYKSAADMLLSVGFARKAQNRGAPLITPQVQGALAGAVDAAEKAAKTTFDSAVSSAKNQVAEWVERVNTWDDDADALIARSTVEARRVSVKREAEIAKQMVPSQTFVRPLVVVLPDDWPSA